MGFMSPATGTFVNPGGAIGRLAPDDVVVLVRNVAQHHHRMSQEG